MGVLVPACIASDGTYLYVFSVDVYSLNSNGVLNTDQSYVLLRSNKSPSHTLSNLSFSLVSGVFQKFYYKLSSYVYSDKDYDCIADESGVFTVFARTSGDNAPRGLQYQPGSDGGSWKNVSTSPSFHWTSSDPTSLSFFKDSTGKSTIMHTNIDTSSNGLYVASLDSSVMSLNQSPSQWAVDKNAYGSIRSALISGTSLYTLGYGTYNVTLATATLTSAATNPPPPLNFATYNATILSECDKYLYNIRMFSLGGKLLISCKSTSKRSQLFTFDGTAFKTFPAITGGVETPLAMTTTTGSSVPFMFIADKGSVYSMPVDGELAGTLIPGYFQVNITNAYGSESKGLSGTGTSGSGNTGGNSGSSGGGGSGGGGGFEGAVNNVKNILIGVGCGVAALIILICCLVSYRARQRQKRSTQAALIATEEAEKYMANSAMAASTSTPNYGPGAGGNGSVAFPVMMAPPQPSADSYAPMPTTPYQNQVPAYPTPPYHGHEQQQQQPQPPVFSSSPYQTQTAASVYPEVTPTFAHQQQQQQHIWPASVSHEHGIDKVASAASAGVVNTSGMPNNPQQTWSEAPTKPLNPQTLTAYADSYAGESAPEMYHDGAHSPYRTVQTVPVQRAPQFRRD